ncbi:MULTISPECIES: hypothetical protein [Halomonadaceae]|nr:MULTISPECIES: hypothetical protein [Halomonas]MCD6007481.1 universal stress protein [Halomonas sp. IOP_31]
MREIMACIDGSSFSPAVCDAAAWASLVGSTTTDMIRHASVPVLIIR